MKIAIVHYHLGLGGVTQTIRSTSPLLSGQGQSHTILCGVAPEEPQELPVTVVPGLHYAERCPIARGISGPELAQSLRQQATASLGGPPDLWHFHNHSIGKNPVLIEAIAHLAAEGERMLLHIHDLAEDGRPALYAAIRGRTDCYPLCPHVHYAFLNERDRRAFLSAGLPAERAHLLASPPSATEVPPSPAHAPPLWFAPIRGIRRKNLGELVLLAVLAPPATRIAVSRAPVDPESLRIHQTWETFARIHAPRIHFNVTDRLEPAPGAPRSFLSWISHSTHFVGTSISEGLGLPFLESQTSRRPFIGRRLPHLQHLVSPSSCYDRLLIPESWIARNVLREQLAAFLARDDRTRRVHPRSQLLPRILDHLTRDPYLDFGNLPESLQQAVIERCSDLSAREEVRIESTGRIQSATPWLAARSQDRQPAEPTPHLPASDPLPVYRHLLTTPVSEVRFLSQTPILNAYHTPESFHFLLAPPSPAATPSCHYKVVIFDIYGTLLRTPQGPLIPDPAKDPVIAATVRRFGHASPDNPTFLLHEAIIRHHRESPHPHPEIDLRRLWAAILDSPAPCDLDPLVIATEDIRSPSLPIPGAFQTIRRLAQAGSRLGIISNAQCNALPALGEVSKLFDPSLTLLSYQLGMAKPAPSLFAFMATRLDEIGIAPHEVLYVGDSLDHDILPAMEQGWNAVYLGHAETPDGALRLPNHVALQDHLFGAFPAASAGGKNITPPCGSATLL